MSSHLVAIVIPPHLQAARSSQIVNLGDGIIRVAADRHRRRSPERLLDAIRVLVVQRNRNVVRRVVVDNVHPGRDHARAAANGGAKRPRDGVVDVHFGAVPDHGVHAVEDAEPHVPGLVDVGRGEVHDGGDHLARMQDPVREAAARAGTVAGRGEVGLQVDQVARVVQRPEDVPVAVDFGVGNVHTVDVRFLVRGEHGRVRPEVLPVDELDCGEAQGEDLALEETVDEVPGVVVPLSVARIDVRVVSVDVAPNLELLAEDLSFFQVGAW